MKKILPFLIIFLTACNGSDDYIKLDKRNWVCNKEEYYISSQSVSGKFTTTTGGNRCISYVRYKD